MANGIGFGPVWVVQEYVKFDVASAAFGSFSIWQMDIFISMCRLHCVALSFFVLFVWLSVCLAGWVGWLVGLLGG